MAKSKISSSLCNKRRIALVKKIGVIFIFSLFFISLFVLFLTTDKIKIKNIVINGNSSVSTEEITKIVREVLDEKYLLIIPTDNFFLLQRFEIPEETLINFKKIKVVDVSLYGFDTLKISVIERVSESFWCFGSPEDSKDCYFMDSSGFIFAQAPSFTNNILIKYYGLISKADPVGENYFSSDKFEKIKYFISELKKMGFDPESFFAINEHQYEISLSGGAKIVFDDKEDLLENLLKLKTLIGNDYIKTDKDSISKINHIDLRYGNKVHYDFK
ncbi:MAG: hypothetical protein WC827_03205 [Candidatus Paceibacterota bacterium]|jgi:cell division septal protein FtsQ